VYNYRYSPRFIAPGPRLNTDGVLGLGRISVAWLSETISYGISQSLEPRSDASANSTTRHQFPKHIHMSKRAVDAILPPELSNKKFKTTHSMEEAVVLAHTRSMLGFSDTVATIMDILMAGDDAGRFDGRFCINYHEILNDFYYEYDGGHYHKDDRIEKDITKTKTKLAESSCNFIVRIRTVGASQFDYTHPRLKVIQVDGTCTEFVHAQYVASAIHELTGIPINLLARANSQLITDIKIYLSKTAEIAWEAVTAFTSNDKLRKTLMMTRGFPARSSVPKFMENLTRARGYVTTDTEFRKFVCDGLMPLLYHTPDLLWECLDTLITKYHIKSLQTFMCNSVTSLMAVDPDKLWECLDKLITKYHIKSLQTFMCDGVASLMAADPDKLWECLDKLITKYHIKSLQTFMGNSVASLMAADPDKLWECLDKLITKYHIKSLQTFMCDGVASLMATDPDKLWECLDKLITKYHIKSLQTFMCSGVASLMANDPNTLWECLDKLITKYHIKSLQTFMCSGVASLMANDPNTLWECLDKLITKYQIKSLQTFMSNSVASLMANDPNTLWKCLDKLITKYQIKSLQTFMCDGVASLMAADPDKLWSLFDEFGQALIKPMCNEVAKKLKDDVWVGHLRILHHLVKDPLIVHACIHRGCIRDQIHLINNELRAGMTPKQLKGSALTGHDKNANHKNQAFLAKLLARYAAARGLLALSQTPS